METPQMLSPNNEARLIVDALYEDFGTGGHTRGEVPYIEGRTAITDMKNDNYSGWREVEWTGYHIKYLIQKECEIKLSDRIKVYDSKKRHFVKGEYLWDARLNANDFNRVPLGDVEEYNNIVKQNKGIGILIFDAVANYDINEDFRRWHEEQKGGSSDYSVEREIEGRSPRIRKTGYMIRKCLTYFLTFDDLQRGVVEGWMEDTFQQTMRNANGSSRNSKYRLKLDQIPRRYLVVAKNFNEDPEEFEEEFPEFAE